MGLIFLTQNLQFLLAGSRAQTPELWSTDGKRPLVKGSKLEGGPDVFALASTLRRGNAGTPVVLPLVEAPPRVDWGSPGGATAIVEFNSAPVGATVRVDGALLCQATPCSKALPAGRHAVEHTLAPPRAHGTTHLTPDARRSAPATLTPHGPWPCQPSSKRR